MSQDRTYPGARWWKFDFHTHTPASSDWAKTEGVDLAPRDWLLRWMNAKIDCVAITDHNSGAWVDKLKSAYAELENERPDGFRTLYLFPGVELSVHGGFHLLAIFDRQKTTSDIDSLLGSVGYHGTKGGTDAATTKSPLEVLDAIVDAGGIPIPAHADAEKGLLKGKSESTNTSVLDANTLQQICASRKTGAIEIIDPAASLPQIYAETGCIWTQVLGSDWHGSPRTNLPGSRYTWIKMGEPSLEGLRLALLDGPRFSVQRSDDQPQPAPHQLPEHFIEAIQVNNMRFMGRDRPEQIRLSPGFNALVGGRGTGKSTVIHALRLAYRRENELLEGSEPARVFREFSQATNGRHGSGALLRDTEIVVNVSRDSVRHRLHWRHGGAGDVVEETQDGENWVASASQFVSQERFPVRIFSQGQIAALTSADQRSLLAFIDEAAGVDSATRVLTDAKNRFQSLRSQEREVLEKLKGREGVEIKLEDVQRKLSGFDSTSHARVLNRFQVSVRQEREIERQFDGVNKLANRIRSTADALLVDDPPPGVFEAREADTRPALVAVARLREAVDQAAKALNRAAETLEHAVTREKDALQTSAWRQGVEHAKNEYGELTAKLGEQGVSDPSEYAKLVQRQQQHERELQGYDDLAKEAKQLSDEIDTQKNAVREARRRITQLRQDFLKQTLAHNDYVKISIVPYGIEAKSTDRALRDLLGIDEDKFESDVSALVGSLALSPGEERSHGIETRLDTWGERFENAARGSGDFGGYFNNYLLREGHKRPELIDQLLLFAPEDALDIQYSRKGNGAEFSPIEQASAGQRAAAMLAFLLAHGTEPIVLDQPEDDLDNHLIYELVVHQIRENKLHRQLIIVTHNPNIVVNGDAEMIHAFDFRGGQCRVVDSGCLQDSSVRKEVCRVMEGGEEAFERRYRRLGERGNG